MWGQEVVWDHLYQHIGQYLDPLTKFYLATILPVYTHGWDQRLTELCHGQLQSLTRDIDTWHYHAYANLPRRDQPKLQDRVIQDLEVLQTIKMNNLNYSRAIQDCIKRAGEKQTHMKHFWYRVFTSVGNLPQGRYGQRYGHVFILLDYHTQDPQRDSVLEDPIDFLATNYHMRVMFGPDQARLLGPGEKVTAYINITHENGWVWKEVRVPRLRYWHPPNDEQARDFLRFLKHKKINETGFRKYIAPYQPNRRLEPFALCSPPLEVQRHMVDQWNKVRHRLAVSTVAPDCQAWHKKKMRKPLMLLNHVKRLQQKTGVDVQHLTGKHKANSHNDTRPTLTHGRWHESCMNNIPARTPGTYKYCFHREPHTCAACCETEPFQELFLAHTDNDYERVRYHPLVLTQDNKKV